MKEEKCNSERGQGRSREGTTEIKEKVVHAVEYQLTPVSLEMAL